MRGAGGGVGISNSSGVLPHGLDRPVLIHAGEGHELSGRAPDGHDRGERGVGRDVAPGGGVTGLQVRQFVG